MAARTVTVASPVKGYTGHVINVEFVDGTATVDRSDVQALAYFRRHGYSVDGAAVAPAPDPPDPREVGLDGDGTEIVGTRLQDAAVDPKPGDFLPPTNAGQENPHGRLVVAPGIHATPPAPIVPGPVSSDAATQQAAETEAAAAALVASAPVDPAAAAEGDDAERPSAKARTRAKPARK